MNKQHSLQGSIDRLQFLCEKIPGLLLDIEEQLFSEKLRPEKWSKKQIIGHLIDSAANNHHRLVRGQFEAIPKITYDQNLWNQYNYYQQLDASQVISFWESYNRHLLELIKNIPENKFSNRVETGESGEKSRMSLQSLIDDYIQHMEHHLQQVVDY